MCLCHYVCLFIGQYMSLHHSDQMSGRCKDNYIVFCMSISKALSEWVSESVTFVSEIYIIMIVNRHHNEYLLYERENVYFFRFNEKKFLQISFIFTNAGNFIRNVCRAQPQNRRLNKYGFHTKDKQHWRSFTQSTMKYKGYKGENRLKYLKYLILPFIPLLHITNIAILILCPDYEKQLW